MKTIRNNVFETNSSSCHVLTIMTEEDVDKLKKHEACIYVPECCSDDNMVFDSEIIDKKKFIEICKNNGIDVDDQDIINCIDYIFDTVSDDERIDLYEYLDEHNITRETNAKLYNEISNKIDEVLYRCFHEESSNNIINGAKVKEIGNNKLYVSVWEKYC